MRAMKRCVKTGCLFLWAFCWMACGGGELDQGSPCRSDADCKHGRVCSNGQCQDANCKCASDEDCPSGALCRQCQCYLCDQDQDQFMSVACAGADCDDRRADVHPGAQELCGDLVDNDCDALTDPPSLCDGFCATINCPKNQVCDPKQKKCVASCVPSCAGRVCGTDGCSGDCGDCPQGQVCDSTGHCVSGCADKCQPGASVCAGASIVRCQDGNGDGCVEWSAPQSCPTGQACVEGRCEACVPNCRDRQCGTDGCGGSCGECPNGTVCQSSRCVQQCQDQCHSGESRCQDDFISFVECGDFNHDGCQEWSAVRKCSVNQKCDPAIGRCSGGCLDECSWGTSVCLDSFSYRACQDWDNDGCAELGQPVQCPNGTVCQREAGQCVAGCQDECSWGQSRCQDDFSYFECGEWDGDSCLEWGWALSCPQGSQCDFGMGSCQAVCTDECSSGDFICESERRYRVCGQYDGDPCNEWSQVQRCEQHTWCSQTARACVACQDECQDGQQRCLDQVSFISCGQFDSDPCLDWSQRQVCPDGIPCDGSTGACSSCVPDCSGRECGPDPICGGDCGRCQGGLTCDQNGRCVSQGPFASACLSTSQCENNLMCLVPDANFLGFCDRMCSGSFPCPNGFECLFDDGQGGRWCMASCARPEDCLYLGAWTCVFGATGLGMCLPLWVSAGG